MKTSASNTSFDNISKISFKETDKSFLSRFNDTNKSLLKNTSKHSMNSIDDEYEENYDDIEKDNSIDEERKNNVLYNIVMGQHKRNNRENGLSRNIEKFNADIQQRKKQIIKEKNRYIAKKTKKKKIKKHWDWKEHQWRNIKTAVPYRNNKVLSNNSNKHTYII